MGKWVNFPEMKCFFKYQFILTAAEVQMENINGNHTLFAVQYHLSVHPELEKMQLYLTETLSNVPGIPPLHPLRRSLSDMETVLDWRVHRCSLWFFYESLQGECGRIPSWVCSQSMILTSVDESNPAVTSLKPQSNPRPQAVRHGDTSGQAGTLDSWRWHTGQHTFCFVFAVRESRRTLSDQETMNWTKE